MQNETPRRFHLNVNLVEEKQKNGKQSKFYNLCILIVSNIITEAIFIIYLRHAARPRRILVLNDVLVSNLRLP